MSSVVLPLPKPAGSRPPFGGPPTRTSFESPGDDGGDPLHRRIAASVNQVLKACRDADAESAPMLRRLIAQRKVLVQQELDTIRLLDRNEMPPLLFARAYPADFFLADVPADRLFLKLIHDLDAADDRLAQILRERNASPPAS
jgi:hypothetical protein